MGWIKLTDELPDPGRMVLTLGLPYDTGGRSYFYEVARIRPADGVMIGHPIYGKYVWWAALPEQPEDFYQTRREMMDEYTTSTTRDG